MTDTKYNGWTNYATWRVNLEMFDGFEPDGTMEADDYLAWYNQSQDTWGIEQYESFSAVMVKAIQELSSKVETLESEIQTLKQ